MASKPKSTGRAMLTASMPTSLDDPRLMDVADIVKAVDEMEVSAHPQSLDSIRDLAWAKFRSPARSASPQGDR
jgi:hypothetical protein